MSSKHYVFGKCVCVGCQWQIYGSCVTVWSIYNQILVKRLFIWYMNIWLSGGFQLMLVTRIQYIWWSGGSDWYASDLVPHHRSQSNFLRKWQQDKHMFAHPKTFWFWLPGMNMHWIRSLVSFSEFWLIKFLVLLPLFIRGVPYEGIDKKRQLMYLRFFEV